VLVEAEALPDPPDELDPPGGTRSSSDELLLGEPGAGLLELLLPDDVVGTQSWLPDRPAAAAAAAGQGAAGREGGA
jgi:hypothetical protein